MLNFVMGYVMGERTAARAGTFSRRAGAAGRSGAGDLYDLNLRMDRMLLVLDAMWSLMRENGLTDEDLAARIREIDEADGTLDGRKTPHPVECPHCNSKVSPGRSTCTFCGEPIEVTDLFDGI